VPWNTRADFDRHHLTETIGPSLIFNRLHDAVDAYESQKSLPQTPSQTDAEQFNTDIQG